jgi:hypothetical protein
VKKGVSPNGDPGKCMVSGCDGRALYANARGRACGTVRGYCAKHKALAASSPATEAQTSYNLKRWGVE